MRGNTFGKLFSITTFGESHGEAIGVVIDGMPPGLDVSLEALTLELKKRAPGRLKGTTSRQEEDKPFILSGLMNGKTLGTPIAVIIQNQGQRSKDYDKLENDYRPGHADETTMLKYGIRDHRGGGRSSGRETAARVIGGYFASLILEGIIVQAHIKKLGPFETQERIIKAKNNYQLPAQFCDQEVEDYLLNLKKNGDSVGGIIAVSVTEMLPGLGEPAFDKLKSDLAKAVMSIGACVGFQYGLGADFANLPGSEISKLKENFGGIEGGISNGDPLYFESIFKPTSTIGQKAQEGRHDPCILPRAVPVVESMVKIVLADHLLRQKAYGKA